MAATLEGTTHQQEQPDNLTNAQEATPQIQSTMVGSQLRQNYGRNTQLHSLRAWRRPLLSVLAARPVDDPPQLDRQLLPIHVAPLIQKIRKIRRRTI